ncbi:MAG: 4a-hydroxytetrahydrobiopterin dehydratase [Bacteroidales bacterium]|nr:4a-hydroxytetrahydrobiopterin dehydratase [Bacteroidales bacterium]
MELKEKSCIPCEGGVDPLTKAEVSDYLGKLKVGWKTADFKKIHKNYPFKDFKQAMDFANKVANIAESENHHPDMCVHYGSVDMEISTHAIGGLSENDFILAAKIDDIS